MTTLGEVCFLVGRHGAVLWADRSLDPAALPDSRERWEAIWQFRLELETIAHSHPRGPVAFSSTDRSTMSAVDMALGTAQRYAVVAPAAMIESFDGTDSAVDPEPWWAELLRAASGMKPRPNIRKE